MIAAMETQKKIIETVFLDPDQKSPRAQELSLIHISEPTRPY